MTATFTWTFPILDTAPSENNLVDVVKNVHWMYTCTDGTYTAESYGSVALASPVAQSYISYNSITKQTVIGWVEGVLIVPEIQQTLLDKIQTLKTPAVVPRKPNF